MNDDKWRDLRKLPVEDTVKRKIYKVILAEPAPVSTFNWREIVVTTAVMLLMLFFLTVPTSDRTAAPGQLEAYIYVNEGGEDFHAFPTALYTGIKKVTDPELLQQVAQFPQQLQVVDKDFSHEFFETDLLITEDGQQSRYKLTYDYVLNWDTGEVYAYTEQNENIRWALRDYARTNHFIMIPISMLSAMAVSSIYYRYKRVKRPKYPWWVSIVTVVFAGIGMYFISMKFPYEPIFKPYIWLYLLMFGIVQQWVVQKAFTHPVHLRVEKIYGWTLTLVIAIVLTFF
ncbi:MAG: hypothetical protein ABS951_00055 [Solibacillus sp.]